MCSTKVNFFSKSYLLLSCLLICSLQTEKIDNITFPVNNEYDQRFREVYQQVIHIHIFMQYYSSLIKII